MQTLSKNTEAFLTSTTPLHLSSLEITKKTFYQAIRQSYRYPSLWGSTENDTTKYANTDDHLPFKFFHWSYSDVLSHPSSPLSAIYLLYWAHTSSMMKEAKVPIGDITLRIEEFDKPVSFGAHQELTYFTRILGSVKDDMFIPNEDVIYGVQSYLLQKSSSVPVVNYNVAETDYCFKLLVNAHFSTSVKAPDTYQTIGEFLINEYYSALG